MRFCYGNPGCQSPEKAALNQHLGIIEVGEGAPIGRPDDKPAGIPSAGLPIAGTGLGRGVPVRRRAVIIPDFVFTQTRTSGFPSASGDSWCPVDFNSAVGRFGDEDGCVCCAGAVCRSSTHNNVKTATNRFIRVIQEGVLIA